MSLRPDSDEPEETTPHERLVEVASIFARGILRLHSRRLPDNADIQIPLDSLATCLELPPRPRPDGVPG